MFANNVPNTFWGEVILTIAYLINRLPSKPLKHRTPLSCLLVVFPKVRTLNSLPPKVFGCTTFDPKALKCIFVEYSPTQKG